MKIEKINDNQIRCTLTRDDLNNRQLKLSELAYGTEKAKELFREMMQQAAIEFGFEADNIPLMIEAIPMPNECIVLIITKVEDPEELDTRFAKFAPGGDSPMPEDANDLSGILPEGADNVLDMFKKLLEKKLQDSTASSKEEKAEQAVSLASEIDLTRLYSFQDLDTVIDAAHVLQGFYQGQNFPVPSEKGWRLLPDYPQEQPHAGGIQQDFQHSLRVRQQREYSSAAEAYMTEHEDLMIAGEALQKLAGL